MSLVPPLTAAQQAYVDGRRAIADGGRVAVDPVAGAQAAVMVTYTFGRRRQTRMVLADGYVSQGHSDPVDRRPRRR